MACKFDAEYPFRGISFEICPLIYPRGHSLFYGSHGNKSSSKTEQLYAQREPRPSWLPVTMPAAVANAPAISFVWLLPVWRYRPPRLLVCLGVWAWKEPLPQVVLSLMVETLRVEFHTGVARWPRLEDTRQLGL